MKLKLSLIALMMVSIICLTSGCCCSTILTPVFSDVTENAEQTAIKSEIKNVYAAYVNDCAVNGMGYSSIEEYVFFNGEDYYRYDGTTVNSYNAGYYIGTYESWDIHWAADSGTNEDVWG